MILGKSLAYWKKTHPLLSNVMGYEEVFWKNHICIEASRALEKLPLKEKDILEAEARLKRFAPYIAKVFPETNGAKGIIESPLESIPSMKKELEEMYAISLNDQLLLKQDNKLAISGSVKARGGIYEVLKRAEDLAIEAGMISLEDDYTKFSSDEFKDLFSKYSIVCGSTGNLGLSIGIMSAVLGFNVTIHMSDDAKQWKKDLLRIKGAQVIEHTDDYSKAVEEGRKQSLHDPYSYFIDDENSETLFLGYAVAALRLKGQLKEKGVTVDAKHPLFVYLPCGVGGGPGGIAFGLKVIFGNDVHCFFAEPTHSPCMLLGLMTQKHDQVSVRDFGLDNKTEADGLAVARPSAFVGKLLSELINGVYTVSDDRLFVLLSAIADKEGIKLEPSALAGLAGPVILTKNNPDILENATHIAWSTGGDRLPENVWRSYYEKGISLHKESV